MLILSSRIGSDGIAVSLETSLGSGPGLSSSEFERSAHLFFFCTGAFAFGIGGADFGRAAATCFAATCSRYISFLLFWDGPLNMKAALTGASDDVAWSGFVPEGIDPIVLAASDILCLESACRTISMASCRTAVIVISVTSSLGGRASVFRLMRLLSILQASSMALKD